MGEAIERDMILLLADVSSYLLLTEPAFALLSPECPDLFDDFSLEDKDLGTLKVRVRMLDPLSAQEPGQPSGAMPRLKTMFRVLRWRGRAWRTRTKG